METSDAFGEWKLGFRELFRVGVPSLALLVCGSRPLSPVLWSMFGDELGKKMTGLGRTHQVAAVALAALIWFGLQVPKRLPAYRRRVKILQRRMLQPFPGVVATEKPAYQYLVDCEIEPRAGARIHYFASYYYMFMDISLIAMTFLLANGTAWIVLRILHLRAEGLTMGLVVGSLGTLGVLAIVCGRAAMRFLDDIMAFSIFVVERYDVASKALVDLALNSASLIEYEQTFCRRPNISSLPKGAEPTKSAEAQNPETPAEEAEFEVGKVPGAPEPAATPSKLT
jgi:hypothetical protein